MKRKPLKIIISLFFVIVLLNAMIINIFAVTYTIDNDDAQGFGNFNKYFELYYGKNLWYGDARIAECGDPNNYYEYIYPIFKAKYSGKIIHGEVKAWLYDINFTDTNACYMLNDTSYTSNYYAVGSINQDLAAPGWNKIGSVSLPSSQSYSFTDRVRILPNWLDTSGKNKCGADAIEVRVYK